jgi:outer membrane protein assembly factor BamA
MGILKLQQRLADEGYRSAEFLQQNIEHLDHRYGVSLIWDQGVPCFIHEISAKLRTPENVKNEFLTAMERSETCPEGVLARTDWIDQQLQFFRRIFYEAGYADSRFDYSLETIAHRETEQQTRLVVTVETGLPSTVGQIFLEPKHQLDQPFYRRRVTIAPGMPLNPDDVVATRNRLQSLGTFDYIDISYDPLLEDGSRNIHFVGKQKRRNEGFFRIGGGNYDLLRVGIDWEQRDLWRHAHLGRLQAIQSAKRTYLAYDYQIPEVLGPRTSIFFSGEYLRREERTFIRKDLSAALGLERNLPGHVHCAVQYRWSSLEASTGGGSSGNSRSKGCAGALLIALERSNLDNPLCPSSGRRWAVELEIANPFLGGNSEYERLEGEWAGHRRVSDISLFHWAVRHGFIYTFGDPAHCLPFNKRFFNGGANSMRGFHDGQASPIDDEGKSMGAAAYTLVNLEFEHNLFNRVSGFAFFDGIGFCENARDYPFNAYLASAGPGLAYQTFLGPLRIAYAWNFKRRPSDSRNAWRFSVGFPF